MFGYNYLLLCIDYLWIFEHLYYYKKQCAYIYPHLFLICSPTLLIHH